MMAGIAQADLTLPPGYPMSGYSINGRISRGYWIRPKATALYLLDTAGTPFVFVTTDLWAITDGQKMEVLKALSEDDSTRFIGESELLLCATHTHHSSGVIELDKAFASTSIGFGIDTVAFRFTIRQIVSAIKDAILSKQPATVLYAIDTVSGIAKNRSRVPYFSNSEAERQAYFSEPLAKDKFYRTRGEIESAIENKLSVITIKGSGGKINGILASYPMHPTATGDATEVYSADVFGLASAKAADEIPGNPIVAFYNGAEGDVAPDYRFHHRSDAVRIADRLSTAINRLSQSANQILLSNDTITHRTTTISIASKEVVPDSTDRNCYVNKPTIAHTDDDPVIGAAVLAGASDGRTSLSSFGISDGILNKEWKEEQGSKMPAVDFVTDNVWKKVIPKPVGFLAKRLGKIKPKSEVHISLHRVGTVVFAGLPGEFTTMMGRRIRRVIADSLHTAYHAVSLVGLADAYVSYITTPCEYEKQYYEGASTFFGLSTGPVFIMEYRTLAGEMKSGRNIREGRKAHFNAGRPVTFGPDYLGDLQVWNAEEGLHNLLVSADGYRVFSREIPPINPTDTTIDLDSNEIVAYSFYDQVNTIGSNEFYPLITLRTIDNRPVPLPEHILTVDSYAKTQATWTVRILNTSLLPVDTPLQIVVNTLSGTAQPPSGFFRRRGFGVR